MERKYSNLTALYLFITVVAVASIIYLGLNFKEFDTYSLVLSLFGASAAILGFVTSSENYLKSNRGEEKEKSADHNSHQTIKKQVIKSVIAQTGESLNISHDTIEDPIEIPQKEMISRGYDYEDFVSLRRRDVIMFFRKTEQRLKNEIESLKRRANINMIIGAVIAFVGVLGLVAFIVSEQGYDKVELSRIIIHWITRLGLVTFVEIFAFFFLKMYRTELLSIQYYHDELTSIESRKIALLFSVIHDNKDDISKTIDCLVNIDRNFKIDSNQTTVDLEKLKTENHFIRSELDSLTDILKGNIFNKA